MDTEEILVPIAALNNYDYCPRCCWYIYVAGEWSDNEFTVAGTRQHQRVDTGEFYSETGLKQWRAMPLHAQHLGLIGKADLVEEMEGRVYPVEYKVGPSAKWRNDRLQLCAQALALEEMLDVQIDRAFMYYAASHQRIAVELNEELRQETENAIAAVRMMLITGDCPPNPYKPQCRGCSLYDVCLPKETEKARATIALRELEIK
ncbi:MAG TPA: CRISPR-associated protein Cas4, partial [Cyanobacteria bacterium UBA8803]|nr:CRISPR-associated protein Cas4 [Cyanobacteria bacterium UBA9273]HBL58587.1 CRISPR-associated protein Cas4 [Cyanobacteria bacterium UBA8803]